jgi:hypothetical protein
VGRTITQIIRGLSHYFWSEIDRTSYDSEVLWSGPPKGYCTPVFVEENHVILKYSDGVSNP